MISFNLVRTDDVIVNEFTHIYWYEASKPGIVFDIYYGRSGEIANSYLNLFLMRFYNHKYFKVIVLPKYNHHISIWNIEITEELVTDIQQLCRSI